MHRFSPLLFWAALLAAPLLVSGCAHHDTVVGTWTGTIQTPLGQTQQFRVAFTPDGREAIQVQITKAAKTINFDASGSYQINGNAITQTMTAISVNGQAIPTQTNSVKSETDDFQLKGDTLTLTVPGSHQPLILNRQSA